jgi:hypothetical protein
MAQPWGAEMTGFKVDSYDPSFFTQGGNDLHK